jgi:hypothetical protein
MSAFGVLTTSTTVETNFNSPHHTVLKGLSTHMRNLQGIINPGGTSDDDATTRCPVCLGWGHLDDTCPQRVCEYCEAVEAHSSHACPDKPKCATCKRIGHSAESCTPELASAVNIVCKLCHGTGHIADQCSTWFRRYRVESDENVVPLANWRLTISCYNCGSKQHFGGDCPKFPKLQRGPFSAEYVNKFIEQSVYTTELKTSLS